VTVVSLLAFVGIVFIDLKEAFLRRILMALIGFASGSLIGGAFIHLLPEAFEETGQAMYGGFSRRRALTDNFVIPYRHCWRSHNLLPSLRSRCGTISGSFCGGRLHLHCSNRPHAELHEKISRKGISNSAISHTRRDRANVSFEGSFILSTR